jgi:hypothetical protein
MLNDQGGWKVVRLQHFNGDKDAQVFVVHFMLPGVKRGLKETGKRQQLSKLGSVIRNCLHYIFVFILSYQ